MSGGLVESHADGPGELSAAVRVVAEAAGFDLVGIAPAVTPTGFHRLLEWLDAGYQGEMQWMESRREARRHPESVLPRVRSLVIVGLNYFDGTPAAPGPRISRYAWGHGDYHRVLKERLQPVAELIRGRRPGCRTRIVVDTAPLLERDFGRLAGLGWFGRNTMLISRRIGSWFFLGAILTDAELAPDAPEDRSWCGTCTRCLDACPTQAFPEPGVLDAQRCISYLTIELRGAPVPLELREGMGEWLFGCDVCQEVCPWNRFAPETANGEFVALPKRNPPDCRELLRMTRAEFAATFAGTPLERPGYGGLRRNAAIVLGNLRDHSAVPELSAGLRDEEPLVRGASAWALAQIGDPTTTMLLRSCLEDEVDALVRGELERAICSLGTADSAG
ncbi:MAG: Epoxyqueuosine reductase [Planctomycetota bacterium]|jgi:epoxyqueuosine reductase